MTKRAAPFILTCIAVIFVAPAAVGQPLRPVCGRPNVPCKSSYEFKSYQLPFVINEKLVFGKSYKSVSFYAVIVKSVKANATDECTFVAEDERTQLQSLFPDRKVFVSRFNCPEELIGYSNVNQEFNFLAVYADVSLANAKAVLTRVKERYPQAYLKRIQAFLEYST